MVLGGSWAALCNPLALPREEESTQHSVPSAPGSGEHPGDNDTFLITL